MKSAAILAAAVGLLAIPAWGGIPSDQSFLSVASPGNCNTPDNAIVTAQTLFGSGNGFGCLKTVIFPQFAVGNGWTTQVTGFMPPQVQLPGLVTGTNPGFAFQISLGSGAKATLNNGAKTLFTALDNGCLGLWEALTSTAFQTGGAVIDSGTSDHGNFTGLANVGSCGGTDQQLTGGGEGPMQMQIIAPNANAIAQATGELTYFYDGGTFQWQVTVNPIDINSAKTTWTGPLYQGGDYVTAFSVVNAANFAQTVTVTLHDDSGNPIGNAMTTPSLAAGCGCNQWNQSAVGGYYASTISDFFGDIGTQTGTIEFNGQGKMLVIVLRTIKNSLGSMPAR